MDSIIMVCKIKKVVTYQLWNQNYTKQYLTRQQNPNISQNLVGKATFGELHQTGWSRGARTDKGVHALCNAVSMKLWIRKEMLVTNQHEPIEKLVQESEKPVLPSQETNQLGEPQLEQQQVQTQQNSDLQVFPELQELLQQKPKQKFDKYQDKHNIDFLRVVNLINSNLPNDMRVYSCKLVTQVFDVRKSASCRLYEYLAPLSVYQPYDDMIKGIPPSEEFRNQVFQRLQGVVKKFQGSHNFHNYSRGLKAKDPSAHRYIINMEVEPVEHKGHYFFRFRLTGQSFVYHQIRKMIGMTIQLYQEDLPDTFIENTFFSNQLRIMLAPAQGLFLNRILFDGYNKKADIPEILKYSPEDEAKINEFRPTIEDHIFNQEIENKVFTTWLKEMHEKGMNVEESDGEPGGDE